MSDLRTRVLEPLLIPLCAFIFVGAIAWGFSRLLLVSGEHEAVVLAMVMSIAIIITAGVIADKGFHLSQKAALVLATVGVVAGGSVTAATLGIRPIHKHTPEPSVVLVAKDLKWDKTSITLPADKDVVVRVDNTDKGVPHNFGVVKGPAFPPPNPGDIVFDPKSAFNGIATHDYELTLPAGGYSYFCFIHPGTMFGKLTVGEGGAPPPGGAPSPPATPPTAPPPPAAVAATVTIVAQSVAFDKKTFSLPAEKPVALVLDNRDPQIPHNVAIYKAKGSPDLLFATKLLTGPAKETFTFTAPPAGSYYFQCDVHPTQMNGSVTVS